MQIVKIAIRTESIIIIDDDDEFVPAGKNITINSPDIDVDEYSYGVILIKAGTETGTATIDVKYQVKGSNGVYYDHTSATQVTGAGSSLKSISNLDGEIGRIVVSINGSSTADGFAAVNVEFVIKSR